MGRSLKIIQEKWLFWKLFILFFFLPQLGADRPNLHVCTTATHWKPTLDQLIYSCQLADLEVSVYSLGETFQFEKKIYDCQKFIETLPDEDIVLYLDAYDVVVLANKDEIIDRFLEIDFPIVFSGSPVCHPLTHLAKHFPKTPTKFKYLNSGTYIGYVKDLKRVFKKMCPLPENSDDQGLMTAYYLYHPDEILLDYQCQIFLTLHGINREEIEIDPEKKRVFLKRTNASPCIIHGNGPGQVLYQEIYDQFFAD